MTGNVVIEGAETAGSRRVDRKSRREGPTPEDALAAVREGLGKKVSAATTTANEAIDDRNKMAATALATVEARLNDREQALASQIASTKTAIDAARAAKKSAREAGDGDAQDRADEALIEATANLKVYELQKQAFDAEKPRLIEQAKEAAKPVAAVADNSASDAWIASRPRFNQETDPEYYETAIEAHKAALADGLKANTKPYFDKIDRALERTYGKDHATGGAKKGNTMMEPEPGRTPREPRASETSMAAPVGREAAGDGYRSQHHNLQIVVGQDGKRGLTGTIPKEWAEGAKWTGMDPVAYAISMLDIEAEGAAANGGFDPSGRGVQVYR